MPAHGATHHYQQGEQMTIDNSEHAALARRIANEFVDVIGDAERGLWTAPATQLKIVICDDWKGREVKTAATDGKHIFFNPKFYNSLTRSKRRGLILHEVLHNVAGDPWRRGTRDPKKWNIATDYANNILVLGCGEKLPDEGLINFKYRGWSAERIYDELFNQPEPDGPGPDVGDCPGGEPGGDDGEPSVEDDDQSPGEGESSDDDQPGDGDGDQPGEGDGPGDGDPDETKGGGGSGQSDGDDGDGVSDPDDDLPTPDGEVWDATDDEGNPLDEEQCKEALADLAEEIDRGKIFAGTSGSSDARTLIDRITRPRAGWIALFDRFLSKRGKPVGRTYSRLDRRGLSLDIVYPGQVTSGIRELVIGIDKSSSVDLRRLRAFLSHLDKFREQIRIEKVHVVPFNYYVKVDEIVTVKHGQKLPRDFDIGGGTRFAPVFTWAKRHAPRADAVVIFTDLGSGEYGEEPRCPVLWASSDPIHEYNKPPFGHAIEIDFVE